MKHRSEFALGEAVFYQNGTWAYSDITGNEVADEDLGMLPIYIGVDGEENQGLCTGSENYWCVNNKASEEDIQATLDFLDMVYRQATTGRDSDQQTKWDSLHRLPHFDDDAYADKQPI